MAAGYARSRPPVHPEIIRRVSERLNLATKFKLALDVGCGSGLSTKALEPIAERCIGIEPAERMVRWAGQVIRRASFLVAAAESIPLACCSVDLMTAAGSLNYVDLGLFFREAARVLAASGMMIVYDFGPGRRFSGSAALTEWFEMFVARYPWPPNEARDLNPEIIAREASGFAVVAQEDFEISLTLAPEFYLNYMLTETNVAHALRQGSSYGEIRDWCAASLAPVWKNESHSVVFRGYYVSLLGFPGQPNLNRANYVAPLPSPHGSPGEGEGSP